MDAALLDQMNIVYVAMTRPVERLDVLAETAKLEFDRTEPGSVSQWVLACAEDVTGGSFGADGDALSHGTPDRKAGEESTENASEVDVVTTRLHLGEQAAQRVVLAPGHTSQVHADTLDEAALGTLVHDVLSQVRHAGDWPQIRARFEARWTLSAEDRATVLTWADRVFAHDASAAFFETGATVECEPEWMDDDGPIRPDRVVQTTTGWHVVDFKTGAENVEKHASQVRRYMDALAALENTAPRGWILYLNPWRLVEVPVNAQPRIFEAN